MFRRRKSVDPDVEADAGDEGGLDETALLDPRARGPWDVSEVDVADRRGDAGDARDAEDEDVADGDARVDLGSLLVTPREGLEVQLQVEESTGEVMAVVIAGEEGAVELRAFAAPRGGDIWDGVRQAVAAEITRMGGTATEADGPFGPELRVSLEVEVGEGQRATQPSRVLGIAGPRWLLRATLFGRPGAKHGQFGSDPDLATVLIQLIVFTHQ